MNILAFLYVFALFYVFIPGTVITLPIKGGKMVHSMVHAVLFSIILFFTYRTVFQFSVKEGQTPGQSDQFYDQNACDISGMGTSGMGTSGIYDRSGVCG